MTRSRAGGIAWALAALTAIVFAITPILWMLLTSLKSNREITQETSLVPQALTTANYISLFSGREFASYLTNSVIVTGVSVGIALILGTQAAYVLARFRLRAGMHRYVGFSLLMVRLLPPVVIIIPLFLVAVTLRAIDALTTFDQVYVLTRGGPGTATQLISIYGYQTFFQFQQVGYAAAMLFMVALVVLVAAGFAVGLMRRRPA